MGVLPLFLGLSCSRRFEFVWMIFQRLFRRLLNALMEGAVTTEFGSA